METAATHVLPDLLLSLGHPAHAGVPSHLLRVLGDFARCLQLSIGLLVRRAKDRDTTHEEHGHHGIEDPESQNRPDDADPVRGSAAARAVLPQHIVVRRTGGGVPARAAFVLGPRGVQVRDLRQVVVRRNVVLGRVAQYMLAGSSVLGPRNRAQARQCGQLCRRNERCTRHRQRSKLAPAAPAARPARWAGRASRPAQRFRPHQGARWSCSAHLTHGCRAAARPRRRRTTAKAFCQWVAVWS